MSYTEPTGWRAIFRRIVPSRWRKPLETIRESPSIQVRCDDPMWRLERSIGRINKAVEALIQE